MLMALVVIFTNTRPLNMDKHLFSNIIGYSILALFALGFIALFMGLFNTSIEFFTIALLAIGACLLNKTL